MSPPEQFEMELEENPSSRSRSAEFSTAGLRASFKRMKEYLTPQSSLRYQRGIDDTSEVSPQNFPCQKFEWTLLLLLTTFFGLFLIFLNVFHTEAVLATEKAPNTVFLNETLVRLQNSNSDCHNPTQQSLEEVKERVFATQMRSFVVFEGFELNCNHEHYSCRQPNVSSKGMCGAVCRKSPWCLLMAFTKSAIRGRNCRLFDRTPFELAATPHPNNNSSLYLHRSAIGAGKQKNDGRFYFVPSTATTPMFANALCRRGSRFYHLALLAFDEQSSVSAIAEEMSAASLNQTGEGLLLWMLTGKMSSPNDTYEDIAQRVSPKLTFDLNQKPMNNKFLTLEYRNSSFANAEYGKLYRVLCQGDPFNLKKQSQFYLNLPTWDKPTNFSEEFSTSGRQFRPSKTNVFEKFPRKASGYKNGTTEHLIENFEAKK